MQPCPDAREDQHGEAGGSTGREQDPPEYVVLQPRRILPDDRCRAHRGIICVVYFQKFRSFLCIFFRNQFHQPEELSVIHISSSFIRKFSSFFRVRDNDIFTRL